MRKLVTGDILLFPHGSAHELHDESDAAPAPARQRPALNVVFHENDGTGDRLDMMCGRFTLSAAHDRLIRSYLPRHHGRRAHRRYLGQLVRVDLQMRRLSLRRRVLRQQPNTSVI
jgi:AraC family transcriptional regulator, activator of mtrCDE